MALDSTEGSLKQRGVRLTRQRQILLELIDRTGAHLDVEQLYRMAKERDPKINRVTVYRTLKMLKAGGLVDELETPEGMAVHAYLHRKEGSAENADYWYGRAGRGFQRATLEGEWEALVEGLLG